MKVILTQDVINLGEEGDVVVAKDGYARNYLLPSGSAIKFNKTNMAIVKSRNTSIELRKEEKRKSSATLAERLNDLELTLIVSAGDSGKLFGSVTSLMVQDALAKEGIEIERKKIEVSSQMVKMVGTYSIRIHLYESDFATVKLNVESEAIVKLKEMEAKKAAEAAAKEAAISDRATARAAAETAAKVAPVEEVTEESTPVTE
ncbi:MAG: 50S ribosomal protein L9 [Spirochaetaceae bacterium]|nr:50S ribosomal protein L9 [Spirochaetaceae bacterium]